MVIKTPKRSLDLVQSPIRSGGFSKKYPCKQYAIAIHILPVPKAHVDITNGEYLYTFNKFLQSKRPIAKDTECISKAIRPISWVFSSYLITIIIDTAADKEMLTPIIFNLFLDS